MQMHGKDWKRQDVENSKLHSVPKAHSTRRDPVKIHSQRVVRCILLDLMSQANDEFYFCSPWGK